MYVYFICKSTLHRVLNGTGSLVMCNNIVGVDIKNQFCRFHPQRARTWTCSWNILKVVPSQVVWMPRVCSNECFIQLSKVLNVPGLCRRIFPISHLDCLITPRLCSPFEFSPRHSWSSKWYQDWNADEFPHYCR